ncbi:MAG: hypothetical protein RL219_191 [Actinomycetota bacterium]
MPMFAKLLLERCVRAFLAAALATLAAGVTNSDLTVQGGKALIVGAIASGVSACITLVSQFFGDPNSTSFTKVQVEGK